MQSNSNKMHRLSSRTESVIALTRHSITIERPLNNRNTYSGTGAPQQLPVTTSFEIQRMRDSIIQKRQFKRDSQKRKKCWLVIKSVKAMKILSWHITC